MSRIGQVDDVSAIALGGNVFGWTVEEAGSFEVLDRYLDSGGNLIDTADAYMMWGDGLSGAESETILGRWFASRRNRDRVVLATKVGMWDRRPGLSSQNIRVAVEESLRRLHTDHIDVYFAHTDDLDTPQEETLAAFTDLVKEGKVREIGASNFSPERLASALEVSEREGFARFVALQTPYNLMERRGYEQVLRGLATSAGLAVLPYYGLAQGFLAGKYRTVEDRGDSPRAAAAMKYVGGRGLAVLAALDELAVSHGLPVAAIALAWLRSHSEVVAPVASARTLQQLDEIMAGLDLVLTDDEVNRLVAASA